MRNLLPRPKEAIVAVNYRCNARCRMCDIWRVKEDGALAAEDYRRLPTDLENVGVTGGEPFLRKDIVDVVRTLFDATGRPQIIINTNGYLTDRIVSAFRELRSLRPVPGFGISVDGIGRAHDQMRGTRHAFEKVLTTVRALKAENCRNIRLSFTVTEENVTELPGVYELSRRMGVQFASTIAHNSDHYFHTSTNRSIDRNLLRQAYDVVNQRELSSRSVKSWLRAYYNEGVVRYNELGTRLTQCRAAEDFFFLSPRGDVYPCLVLPNILGNIMLAPFEDLWTGSSAESIRTKIRGCEQCWMMCTARTALKKRPLAAGMWVAKQQLRRLAFH
jgi:MoaA/NifB/PqqE/SkfB family radical SAM enzyme